MVAPAYTTGQTVPVTVPLPVDPTGAPLALSAVTYTVTDETGAIILDTQSATLPGSSASTLSVSIPSSTNTLSTAATIDATNSGTLYAPSRGLRQVNFTFTDASGNVYFAKSSYIINAVQPLTRMDNTFITLPESVLVRYEMPPLTGWDAATEDQQIAALISAYNSMLQMRYKFPIGEDWQSRIVDFYGMSEDNIFGRIYIVLADIAFYTEEDYDGWPATFQQALKRAQMMQADYVLGGNPIATKRDLGVSSETVGESSTSFRKIPNVVMPVCPAALQILRGFLNNDVLLGRG